MSLESRVRCVSLLYFLQRNESLSSESDVGGGQGSGMELKEKGNCSPTQEKPYGWMNLTILLSHLLEKAVYGLSTPAFLYKSA